jgi:hypothetical protein
LKDIDAVTSELRNIRAQQQKVVKLATGSLNQGIVNENVAQTTTALQVLAVRYFIYNEFSFNLNSEELLWKKKMKLYFLFLQSFLIKLYFLYLHQFLAIDIINLSSFFLHKSHLFLLKM